MTTDGNGRLDLLKSENTRRGFDIIFMAKISETLNVLKLETILGCRINVPLP